jgi:uncharacterized protein YegL
MLLLLTRGASAQEYYGVPIEDGGVAFLLDVSGSMDNKGEQIKAAAQSMLRGLAEALKDTQVGRSPLGQSLRRGPAGAPVAKMAAAREELMHALDSLRDGTNFTIITFGERGAEWPGGIRAAGPAAKTLARAYVAGLAAGGGTPMAEALQLGFDTANVRTLFVVSDGRPTTAPVLDLVKRLQESRQGRRMVINTVGIGRDQDGYLLCQLALDNEGVYVRDGAVACTFSPCAVEDGVVTFYPASAHRKRTTATPICSTAQHPDCTPELVFDTMLSEARFQMRTRVRSAVTNCLQLQDPFPATIVVNPTGLEATTYTRPGNPFHPSKITRTVKQRGDEWLIETSGVGKGGWDNLDAVDQALLEAVRSQLAPIEPIAPQPATTLNPRSTKEPDAPLQLPHTAEPRPPHE